MRKFAGKFIAVLLLLSLSLTFVLIGCGGSGAGDLVVDTENVDMVFEVGTKFNADNLVVYAKHNDGKNVRISSDEYEITVPDTATAGEKTVTVTYGELTTSYTVSVVVKEQTAVFKGTITSGLGAGETMSYEAEFKCYNTLTWELWYTDYKPEPKPVDGTYGIKDSGRYKLKNGEYTMMLTTKTEQAVRDSSGKVSFFYLGVGLSVYGGQKNGTFYGTLVLEE